MPDKGDESGFPRQIGRSLGQPSPAVLVGRKRTRAQFGNEGDLAILPLNDQDQLIVEAITPGLLEMLTEIRDQLKELNAKLPRELR